MAKKRSAPQPPLLYGIRPAPSIPTHVTVAQGIDSYKWAHGMFWVPVISSNVAAIAYDKKQEFLYLRFSSNRTWRYPNVPISVAELCFNVSSVGVFEHRVLRKRYPGVEVTGQSIIP